MIEPMFRLGDALPLLQDGCSNAARRVFVRINLDTLLCFLLRDVNGAGDFSVSGVPLSACVVGAEIELGTGGRVVRVYLEAPEFQEVEPGRMYPEAVLTIAQHRRRATGGKEIIGASEY